MIGSVDYRYIASIITDGQFSTDQAVYFLELANLSLNESQINPVDRYYQVLQQTIVATYSYVYLKHKTLNKSLSDLISSLNKYVLDKYNHNTIDEFLLDNFTKVPQKFADINSLIGFEITEVGEDDSRFVDVNKKYSEINKYWKDIGFSALGV